MRQLLVSFLFLAILLPLDWANAQQGAAFNLTFHYEEGRGVGNPLKGFLPFHTVYTPNYNFPFSMEYAFFPVGDVMNGENSFSWSAVESELKQIALNLHQAVLRPYLDYPGLSSTGTPSFLLNGGGALDMFRYEDYGGGFSPDYSNMRLLDAIQSFIHEFGTVYDGDPRIGFIEVGLLGFWGEWHTYQEGNHKNIKMPPREVQDTILEAYSQAFRQTKLLVSADQVDLLPADDWSGLREWGIGIHDDNIPVGSFSTTGVEEWLLYPRLILKDLQTLWERAPMGGEIQPLVQEALLSGARTDLAAVVAKMHFSWALCELAFDLQPDQPEHATALRLSATMGYNIFLSSATLSPLQPSAPAPSPLDPVVCGFNDAAQFSLFSTFSIIRNATEQTASTPPTQVAAFLGEENTPLKDCFRYYALNITLLNGGNAPFYYDLFLTTKLKQLSHTTSQPLSSTAVEDEWTHTLFTTLLPSALDSSPTNSCDSSSSSGVSVILLLTLDPNAGYLSGSFTLGSTHAFKNIHFANSEADFGGQVHFDFTL
eukprot:GCRY01004632.1.p1 GENE.GCRY01004632.1~~GCRY01004632.1.p1  ORF type:complete len:557 (+),score=75.82 GCRY01004632.1:52-1671(+)